MKVGLLMEARSAAIAMGCAAAAGRPYIVPKLAQSA